MIEKKACMINFDGGKSFLTIIKLSSFFKLIHTNEHYNKLAYFISKKIYILSSRIIASKIVIFWNNDRLDSNIEKHLF